jgi:uncharacterized membrane protein YdjX (TVP38/TMEM64 family)
MLINRLCGMKRKAHGAQEPRHILKSLRTAQRSDSPARAINQRFPKTAIPESTSITLPFFIISIAKSAFSISFKNFLLTSYYTNYRNIAVVVIITPSADFYR